MFAYRIRPACSISLQDFATGSSPARRSTHWTTARRCRRRTTAWRRSTGAGDASSWSAITRSTQRGSRPTVSLRYRTAVNEPDPDEDDIRFLTDATAVFKADGIWYGNRTIWFVSSYAAGPDADDPEDVTAGVHDGQIWRYDYRRSHIELVALFAAGGPYDGPDNLTVSPHGYALACTDGEDDQWLGGHCEDGTVFPFAFNRLNDSEFAGATFSRDGTTLFANLQSPGHTFAIWGPWRGHGGH